MEKIGNYEFSRNKEKILGCGSFSTVYLGNYYGQNNAFIKKDTPVAIKIIKTNNIPDKAREILNDEMNIMELIKYDPHPNIVGCYDVINSQNETFIIMEYCDSGDLRGILKKPIKEKYAQFYFCQLANGLKYLDNNYIIHRDIKPKNILLTNSRRILKIADFGFAKKFKDQSLHETICGSPLYMSPEIINNNLYNNQTDLWSIGMILFEMLYGFHPYGNCKNIPELKNSVDKNIIEIPPIDTKNKDVSENCISLLVKLLQKQAINRINWNEFFNHPWIRTFQYIAPINNKKNDEYEKQLYSTSLGSLSKDEKNDSISSNRETLGTTPIIKMSHLGKILVIENFCDNIDNKEKNEKYMQDDYIFEMEFDDLDKNGSYKLKKVNNDKIIDKSSLFNEINKNFDIIDNI